MTFSLPCLVQILVLFFALGGALCLAEGAKTIEVALVSNFSEVCHSSANPFNNSFRNGVNLSLLNYTPELNSRGLKIKLTEFDYGTSPVRVVEATQKAIASKAVAAIGYNFSTHALIAAPLHQKSGLPMITPSATADRLSLFGKYVHSICANNSSMGRALADYSRSHLKAKTVGMVVAADCAYCEDLAKAYNREFEKRGGKTVALTRILESDTEFTEASRILKEKKPDLVLIPNQELTSARVIASLVKAGIHVPFLGGDGWGDRGNEFIAAVKSSVTPVYFQGYSVSHWNTGLPSEISIRFSKEYRQRYHQLPQDTAVLAYDSMSLLIQAILKADHPTREGVEEVLSRFGKYEGVTGPAFFRGGGSPAKNLVLLETQQEPHKNVFFKWIGSISSEGSYSSVGR